MKHFNKLYEGRDVIGMKGPGCLMIFSRGKASLGAAFLQNPEGLCVYIEVTNWNVRFLEQGRGKKKGC